jgi:hypothetical protein
MLDRSLIIIIIITDHWTVDIKKKVIIKNVLIF